MAAFFTSDNWERVQNTYTMWWDRKIDRPVIGIELVGKDPGRACPDMSLNRNARGLFSLSFYPNRTHLSP